MFQTAEDRAAELDALANPVAGDRWHELYSAWLLVLSVDAGGVAVKDHYGPQILTWTRDEWREHMTYETMPDTPCMSLHSRGNEVEGVLESTLREIKAKGVRP